MMRCVGAFVALVLVLPGCTDFATPAELDREQILGLRVEPATLAPGQRGLLSALVAGPNGPLEIDGVWSCESASVTVERIDGAWWLVIADDAPAETLRLGAEFQASSGPLTATRTIEVGPDNRVNPVIDSVFVDGVAVTEETVMAGSTVELGVAGDFDTEAVGAINWYSTVGEIELYHRANATLEASEAEDGWLMVVGRDGMGGITWKQLQLSVGEMP